MEELFNWVFILATGIIAWHGITYKDKEGEKFHHEHQHGSMHISNPKS